LAYLYSKNIDHGSLKLANIYVGHSGAVKVADPPLFNYTDNYTKIARDRDTYKDSVFLSPELLSALDKNTKKPLYDKQKSDVYTLGMLFLQVGTMTSSGACYDYD
jgi:serine/threonine protein kinase